MTDTRFDRYCQLTAKLGGAPARALLDKLQVLALTQPDTLREIEAFVERGLTRRCDDAPIDAVAAVRHT